MTKRSASCHSLRYCTARFAAPAFAYKIFVSNEGDNTIVGARFREMEVIETVPVGQRPRGITITHDGKYVLLCACDDDTVQIIDADDLRDRRHAALRARSRALRAASVGRPALHRQRGRQPRHRRRRGEAHARHRDSGRRGAGRHGHLAGRQGHGEHVGDDEHGAFHRHGDQPDHPQRAGRHAPALRRVQEGQLGGVGVGGDRRDGQRHRHRDARDQAQDHLRGRRGCGPRRSSRSACASPRTARPPSWRSGRPTASRS